MNEENASSGQAASAVPEGWKPVPVEPTNEMNRAADTYATATEHIPKGLWWWGRVYRAMLEAAPTQPASAPAREGESELAVLMDRNAWRAAMIGLCTGRDYDVRTPELAAEHLRKRLATPAAPAQPREAIEKALRQLGHGHIGGAKHTLETVLSTPPAPASVGVEEFPLPELPWLHSAFGPRYATQKMLHDYARAALRSYSASLGLQARTEGKAAGTDGSGT